MGSILAGDREGRIPRAGWFKPQDGQRCITLDVPDTLVNEAEFGRPGASRGASAFPQARLVALPALRKLVGRGSGVSFC